MWLQNGRVQKETNTSFDRLFEIEKKARRYESNHAGIYEMCKKDYPDILEELEKEPFNDLLDAGCGPAPIFVQMED